MNTPKISIVIPFFNVNIEMFTNCLNSTLSQSYRSFEIIIVNDGSEQKYYDYLESLKKRDDRIRIIHKENGGVSSARNCGTEAAKGDFITYVDADDILHVDFLKQAIEIIEKNNADFVIGAIKKYDVNEIENVKKFSQKAYDDVRFSSYLGKDISYLIPYLLSSNQFIKFVNGGFINRGPFARLLKTELAKSTRFPLGVLLGEDIIWNQKVLKKSNSVIIVENVWYYYIQNNESAVHKYRKDAVSTVNKTGIALLDIVNIKNDDIYKAFCSKILADLRSIIFQNCWSCKENTEKIIKKFNCYLELKHALPWRVLSFRYFRLGNRREKFIYLLYRSNLYFPVFYLYDRITLLNGRKS